MDFINSLLEFFLSEVLGIIEGALRSLLGIPAAE